MYKDVVFFLFLMILILLVVFLTQGGCCSWCKVEQPKPQMIEVPVACNLPTGPLSLPIPKQAMNCPEKFVCFDTINAARIADRDSILKQWIREAKARCGKKADAGIENTKD